jgi:hypothetical protein
VTTISSSLRLVAATKPANPTASPRPPSSFTATELICHSRTGDFALGPANTIEGSMRLSLSVRKLTRDPKSYPQHGVPPTISNDLRCHARPLSYCKYVGFWFYMDPCDSVSSPALVEPEVISTEKRRSVLRSSRRRTLTSPSMTNGALRSSSGCVAGNPHLMLGGGIPVIR